MTRPRMKLPITSAIVLGASLFPLVLSAQRTPERPTIRDSAGTRIVEYRSLSGDLPEIKVETRPFLDLGGIRTNEQEELDPRQPWLSATRLRNGEIVVNEFHQLKFFSGNGQFIRTVGRQGQGPGEFTQTREVCRLVGDTLLVIDYSTGGLSVWTANGTHVRSYGRPGHIPMNGCYGDGTVVAQVATAGAATEADARTVPYARVRLDGTIVTPLGRLPSPEYAGTIAFEVSIVPSGENLYVADGRRLEVRVLDGSGRLKWIVRSAEPPKPITDSDWRQQAESSVPTGVPAAARDRQIAMMMSMKRPPTHPVFRHVRVDAVQRIWIDDYRNTRRWTVFDSSGALVGRLELPGDGSPSPRLTNIERDHIVVLRRDADGASHLSFHRFQLPR